MRRKIFCLALALALLLSGCSLARPEREAPQQDVFCGFYAVAEQQDAQGQIRSGFYDNPHLEVYGSETYDVESIGNLSFDRKVLFGVEDEAGNITFPGMAKGYSLFIFTRTDPGDNFQTTVVQSDMGPGEEGTKITSTDEGDYMSASGTIYLGPPLGAGPDWAEQDTGAIWTLFRVYQARDGRLYLDGGGNSYGGAGGWTASEHQTYRRAENGETVEETTVSVSVKLETVSRLEKLTVYQYGPDSNLLRSDDIPLREDPRLTAAPGAAWVVVAEVYTGGTAKHAAYDLGEEEVSHGFVLLDDAGCGAYAALTIAP